VQTETLAIAGSFTRMLGSLKIVYQGRPFTSIIFNKLDAQFWVHWAQMIL
jgi:hypothetical protein